MSNLETTLPISQQRAYREILEQVKNILTNKKATGLADNNQNAYQDQLQSGQLSFIIIGLTKLFHRLDELQNLIEKLEQSIKNLPKQTTSAGTSATTPAAQIGNTFLSYNPPDK